jgi:hypothetical protein
MQAEIRAVEITEMNDDEVLEHRAELEQELVRAVPIVRVAIAARLARLTKEKRWRDLLEDLCDADDESVASAAELASLVVAGADGYAGVSSLVDEGREAHVEAVALPPAPGERVTVIVHGTWASQDPTAWWKPDGDFYKHLVAEKVEGLRGVQSSFSWSGKNRDSERASAGAAFAKWLNTLAADSLHVVAHSHGANVAMLATRHGFEGTISNLVMLSTPIRPDYVEQTDWTKIPRVSSLQVQHDAVVAIARGVKAFPPGFAKAKLAERVLDGVSGQSKSHSPAVWKEHNVLAWSQLLR